MSKARATGKRARRKVAEAIGDIAPNHNELRRRQILLDSVTATTDVMLAYLDPGFNFVWVNSAYARAANMTPEEMVGRNHFALYPHAENEEIFRKVRDTGEPAFYKDKPFEYPDQPERGVTYWDWSLAPAMEEDGRVSGLVFSLRETTRHKQLELALRESEQRLRIVADFTYDWEYWRSPDNRFLYMSPSCERITGHTREEFMRDPDLYLRITHPDDRQRLADHLNEDQTTRDAYELDFRIVRRDGAQRWITHVCRPVLGEDGRMLGRRSANRDITDRKRAEENLQRNMEELRKEIVERKRLGQRVEYLSRFPSENPYPVLRVGIDGKLAYANAAAAPVLKVWNTDIGGKIPGPWRQAVQSALGNGVPGLREIEAGNETYSFCIAPVRDQDYVNLYGTNITELKEMHRREKLVVAARTALDTVEAMKEGVALVGMDGTVRSVNPALARLVGYPRDELEGRHMVELMSRLLVQDDVEQALRALEEAMRGEIPRINEITLISAAGVSIPVLPTVAFIMDETETPESMVLTLRDISDIVAANKAVRENEYRLAAAQRIAHIGNWHWVIAENTLAWSDEIYRIFGLNPREFGATYETFLESVHPDDRLFVRESVDKALYENADYSIDHRIVLPDGTERIVHQQAEVYRNEAGRPVHMAGTVQDITDRKRAEDRSRIAAALSRLFSEKSECRQYLDAANELLRNWIGCRCLGIRIRKENGDIPYESSMGFSPEFVESECHLSIKTDQCVCTRVITGKPDPQDAPCLTSMGSFFCNDTAGLVNSLSEEEKARFRGVCVAHGFGSVAVIPLRYLGDIIGAIHVADERKGKVPIETVSFMESMSSIIAEAVHGFGVEETLRISEEKYRMLVENLPAITYMARLDSAGAMIYVSPQVERVLGFTPDDCKADPDIWLKQVHPADRDMILETLAAAHSNANPFVIEYRMLTRDGRALWLRDHGAVVNDAAGTPSYVQGVMYDITEEKRADEALRSLASQLALAEEQERKRLATALHDNISQTLALSKIKLGALNRMIAGDEARNALREVRDLFSQALEQTRTLSFELSPPILYELGLHAAVDWLGEKMREQYRFDFSLAAESDLGPIDEHLKVLMFQSIRELLTNAGKHARARRVHVALGRGGGELTAVVEDDGGGFDPESARRRAGEKHSIGLFSIEDRMRHLGGTLRVKSAPGRGTRITLSAPLKPKAEPARGIMNPE